MFLISQMSPRSIIEPLGLAAPQLRI